MSVSSGVELQALGIRAESNFITFDDVGRPDACRAFRSSSGYNQRRRIICEQPTSFTRNDQTAFRLFNVWCSISSRIFYQIYLPPNCLVRNFYHFILFAIVLFNRQYTPIVSIYVLYSKNCFYVRYHVKLVTLKYIETNTDVLFRFVISYSFTSRSTSLQVQLLL